MPELRLCRTLAAGKFKGQLQRLGPILFVERDRGLPWTTTANVGVWRVRWGHCVRNRGVERLSARVRLICPSWTKRLLPIDSKVGACVARACTGTDCDGHGNLNRGEGACRSGLVFALPTRADSWRGGTVGVDCNANGEGWDLAACAWIRALAVTCTATRVEGVDHLTRAGVFRLGFLKWDKGNEEQAQQGRESRLNDLHCLA